MRDVTADCSINFHLRGLLATVSQAGVPAAAAGAIDTGVSPSRMRQRPATLRNACAGCRAHNEAATCEVATFDSLATPCRIIDRQFDTDIERRSTGRFERDQLFTYSYHVHPLVSSKISILYPRVFIHQLDKNMRVQTCGNKCIRRSDQDANRLWYN